MVKAGTLKSGIRAFLYALLLVDICLTLVLYGSSREAEFVVVGFLAHLVAFLSVVSNPDPGGSRPVAIAATSLIVVLLGWTAFQAYGVPASVLQAFGWFSSAATSATGPSISPSDTMDALPRATAPLAIFLAGLHLLRSDDDSRRAVAHLTFIGGCIAAFSILQFLISPENILFETKTYYYSSLTGTFINHNTAATYFGLLSLTSLCCFEKVMERDTLKKTRFAKIEPYVFLGITLLSICALSLTRSRGGYLSTFCAAALYIFWPRPRSRWNSMSNHWPALFSRLRFLPGIFFLVILLAFSGRTILAANIKGLDDPRLCVLPSLVRILNDHLWTGSGFGTFALIFPSYRDPDCGIAGVWDKAHNFFVEGGITLGLIFLPMVALAAITLSWAFLNGLRQRVRSRSFVILGIAVSALVTLHSTVDFSLQVPGLNTYFALLLGACISISCGRRRVALKHQSALEANGERETDQQQPSGLAERSRFS